MTRESRRIYLLIFIIALNPFIITFFTRYVWLTKDQVEIVAEPTFEFSCMKLT